VFQKIGETYVFIGDHDGLYEANKYNNGTLEEIFGMAE
jgi:hypothetical protein